MSPAGAAGVCEPWPVTGQVRACNARLYVSVSSRTPHEPTLVASQGSWALDMPVVSVKVAIKPLLKDTGHAENRWKKRLWGMGWDYYKMTPENCLDFGGRDVLLGEIFLSGWWQAWGSIIGFFRVYCSSFCNVWFFVVAGAGGDVANSDGFGWCEELCSNNAEPIPRRSHEYCLSHLSPASCFRF